MKMLTLEDFLHANFISSEEWERCDISWDTLKAIGIDHQSRAAHLEEAAQFLAKTLQRFSRVHSVRWRVKDAGHLMAKIVRKRAEKSPKYSEVTLNNYVDLITDLVGLRALHLFKSDCFAIDVDLRNELNLAEEPRAYVRAGDDKLLRLQYEEAGFEVHDHPHGYRSIHYVVTAQPTKRKVTAEIQVRTIFEEGWSEIDHTVRYPNFSDDVQVAYLLQVFNRIAGSADELGGFVKTLKTVLDEAQAMANDAQDAARQAIVERDTSIAKMEEALDHLAKIQTGQLEQERISTVKQELAKFKTDDAGNRAIGSDIARTLGKYGIAEAGSTLASVKHLTGLDDISGVSAMARSLRDAADPGGSLAAAKRLTGLEDASSVFAMTKSLREIAEAGSTLASVKHLTGLDDISGVSAMAKALKGPLGAK